MRIVLRKTGIQTPPRERRKRLGGRTRLSGRQAQKHSSRSTGLPGKSPGRLVFDRRRRINLEFFAPAACSVCVAGTFNGWDANASPLRQFRGGRWSVRLSLEPAIYEYRFLVDGVWKPDPAARRYVTNCCGGVNSVLVVE